MYNDSNNLSFLLDPVSKWTYLLTRRCQSSHNPLRDEPSEYQSDYALDSLGSFSACYFKFLVGGSSCVREKAP